MPMQPCSIGRATGFHRITSTLRPGDDQGMTRFVALVLLALVPAQAALAAETLIEAGEWKVSSMSIVNGAVQPLQSKSRCITPEQAQDLPKTFGPVSGTINSTCADPDI